MENDLLWACHLFLFFFRMSPCFMGLSHPYPWNSSYLLTEVDQSLEQISVNFSRLHLSNEKSTLLFSFPVEYIILGTLGGESKLCVLVFVALPGPILQSILPLLNIYYLERIEETALKKGEWVSISRLLWGRHQDVLQVNIALDACIELHTF